MAEPTTTAQILDALQRLASSLKNIDDKKSAPKLSHFAVVTNDVSQGYEILQQGASLVHSTSTKYSLMGKISLEHTERIASDLLRGCQLISTATFVIGSDEYGCARSTRHYAKRAARAILATVIQLVTAFANPTPELLAKESNLAAQKTGAVWDSCDAILKKQVPQGNRNAMRRDLFTWLKECKETLDEFQELLDRGPSAKAESTNQNDEKVDTSFDDYLGGEDEGQYSQQEFPVAEACLALIKCSRGSINVTLKACENAGAQLKEAKDNKEKFEVILTWISTLHDMARNVGEGMTDLGMFLYPSLSFEDLESQVGIQTELITDLNSHVLDATSTLELQGDVIDLANKVLTAAKARCREATEAMGVNSSS